MPLTSRERVIKAINHKEPDRVPVDFTPLYDFYFNLKQYLGMEIDENVSYGISMEVIPHPDVLRRLGVDLISVKLGSPTSQKKDERSDGLVQDEWGVLFKQVFQPGGGRYHEVVYSPLKDATIDDLEIYSWPQPDLPGRGEKAEESARRLYEDTDLGIVGRFGGAILDAAVYLLGMENWMIRLARDKEFINRFLEKITDVQIALDRIGLEAAGKYLQIFKASGEDLGMQMGPLYSMKMFREQLLPHFRRRYRTAREILNKVNPSAKIMLHSCGSIRAFIPDLIESEIDIIDPIQPRAAGMDSAELKRDFGDRLCFHGGIDIQHILPLGTKDEIIQETRTRIQALGKGGGYILAPAHNVQADVPPENLVMLYEAARRYGGY
jgi:uroporphyrinogen decarboxylase